MKPSEIILLNLIEIRRRSEIVWRSLPNQYYNWKPDSEAMTCLESIRHVLESQHLFHMIVNNRGNLGNYSSPWDNRVYTNVEDEVAFASKYKTDFYNTIESFSDTDFETIDIVRTEVNQHRKLVDYLLRIAFHESVHLGQLLDYYRTIGISRPKIWD